MPLPSRLLTLHLRQGKVSVRQHSQLLGTCNDADIDDWKLQTTGRLCWGLVSIRLATFSWGTREPWSAVVRPNVPLALLCCLRPL